MAGEIIYVGVGEIRGWWRVVRPGRAKREAVRLQAAAWFAEGVPVVEIAGRLRVSTNAVYVWRRQRWRSGGELASTVPGGSACRLDEARLARLAAALEQGPAAHETSVGPWPASRI